MVVERTERRNGTADVGGRAGSLLPGWRIPLRLAVAMLLVLVSSTPALAHGMPGTEAALEGIPPWLYLSSGAGVVLLSFGIVGVFAGRETRAFSYRHRTVDVDVSVLGTSASALTVLLYVGVIVLGLLGPDDVQLNAAPPFLVEVYWWVSFGIFVVLVGNVWPVVNPWKTLFEWAGEPSLRKPYPAWLGALPALLLFLAFAWLNMVVFALSSPRLVAVFALGYGGLMVAGMALYGKDDWLWHADAFTRAFDFFGRFAPVELTEDGFELRGYAVGLVDGSVRSSEEVLLVIALLFTLSFDGFKETETYFLVLRSLSPPGLSPVLVNAIVGGALMLVGFAVFVGGYVGCSVLMKRMAGSTTALGDVMARFVLALVPIAIAYHVAHYSLYYLLQHELLLHVLLDPLPGTPIEPDPDLVGALTPAHVWFYMVALIVLGHVIAVWVSHHGALDYFETRRAAVRSQVPMMALMVLYTVVSLWIISQPFGG